MVACPAVLAAVFFVGFTLAFFAVFLAAFWAGPFLAAPASARLSAHRRFVASEIASLPAALIFRFGFAVSGLSADSGALDSAFIAAHLLFWPSAIRRRAAALTLRFRVGASGAEIGRAAGREGGERL